MRKLINRCSSRLRLALALPVTLFVITHTLLPGSAAIDKGSAAHPTRDKSIVAHRRGSLRLDGRPVTNLAGLHGSNISTIAFVHLSVNSLADPGDGACDAVECTLREAINEANENAGPDVIDFSVTGTINLTGVLPGC